MAVPEVLGIHGSNLLKNIIYYHPHSKNENILLFLLIINLLMYGERWRAVQVILGHHEGKTPFEEGCFSAEWPRVR